MARRVVRALAGLAAVTSLAVGGVGFLHTSVGKSLLMKIGGCPAAKVAPADVERARDRSVVATRGDAPAPARPALGFRLDETRAMDVRVWATRRGITCVERREGTLVQCVNVPASALPGALAGDAIYADVSFGFRASDGTLSAVTALSTRLTAEDGAARARVLARALEERGTAPRVVGELSAEHLARGRWATAQIEARWADYLADVTATSAPDGVAVYERYTSGKTSDKTSDKSGT